MGRDAIPELVEGLEDRDDAVRREAARALGKTGAAAAVPSLVVALSDAPDDLVRVSAAEALGRIGRRAIVAIPALIEAVTDDDRRLRLRAAAVLTEIVTAPSPPLGSLQPVSSSQMSQV